VLTWSELAGIAFSYVILIYVVHPPRHIVRAFHIFATVAMAWEILRKIRSARSLPQGRSGGIRAAATIDQRRLDFSAVPKQREGSKYLLLLAPGFALGGAVVLVYSLYSLTIGDFEWRRLSDLIGPCWFLLLGAAMTWEVGGQFWTTRRVLREPVAVIGIVTDATESGLRYRFRDLAGIEHEGIGTEFSGDYYEEMEVPVVYERDNPKNNLPVSALYDEYEVTVTLL
jgi:hypothetical protein